MSNWQDEFLAEYDRQRILQEVEQIRLEKLAFQSRKCHSLFFARLMVELAAWMISSGNQLRKRYEIPATPRVTHFGNVIIFGSKEEGCERAGL